jgi:hypothetical protein
MAIPRRPPVPLSREAGPQALLVVYDEDVPFLAHKKKYREDIALNGYKPKGHQQHLWWAIADCDLRNCQLPSDTGPVPVSIAQNFILRASRDHLAPMYDAPPPAVFE